MRHAFLVLPALLLSLGPAQWVGAYEDCGPDEGGAFANVILAGWSVVINCSTPGTLIHDVAIRNLDGAKLSVYSSYGKYCAFDTSSPGLPPAGTRYYPGESRSCLTVAPACPTNAPVHAQRTVPTDGSVSKSDAPWINFTGVSCAGGPPCCVIITSDTSCTYHNYGRFYPRPPSTSASTATVVGLVIGLIFGLVAPICIGSFLYYRRMRAARSAALDKVPSVITVMPGAVMPGAWPPQPGMPQPPAAYPLPAAYPIQNAYPPPPPPVMPVAGW